MDAQRDIDNQLTCMLNILRKEKLYNYVFGQLNLQNEVIDYVILNYYSKGI